MTLPDKINSIRQVIHSNVSEEIKAAMFLDFIKSSVTPKDVRELLNREDISTKLAASMSDFDVDTISLILDLIIGYGKFSKPKQIEKLKEIIGKIK